MPKGASGDDASNKNRFSEFSEEEAKNRMPPHRSPAETTLSTPRQEARSPARAVRVSLAKVEDGALRRHGRGSVETCMPLEEVVVTTNATAGAERFGRRARPIYDSGAGRSTCNEEDLPAYTLAHTDHPGFNGPSGESIKVRGKARVAFADRAIGTQ